MQESAKLLGMQETEFIKIALKQPVLFYLNSTNINSKIETLAKMLSLPKKEVVDSAKKSPQIFYMKPETLYIKSKISSYYRKLKNIKEDYKLATYISKSESMLYKEILIYLIYNNKIFENLTKSKIEAKLPELLSSCKDMITFKIPKSDFIESFIEYAQNYSKELIGKNVFQFVVKK